MGWGSTSEERRPKKVSCAARGGEQKGDAEGLAVHESFKWVLEGESRGAVVCDDYEETAKDEEEQDSEAERYDGFVAVLKSKSEVLLLEAMYESWPRASFWLPRSWRSLVHDDQMPSRVDAELYSAGPPF